MSVNAWVCVNQIAFAITTRIDGGKSVMVTSSRIRADLRGQGVYARFEGAMIKDLALFSPVHFKVLTVDSESRLSSVQRYAKQFKVFDVMVGM